VYWWEVLGGIYGLLLFLVLGFYLNKMRHLPSLKHANEISTNGPLVSIIVPVKNEADTIEECLSSLINLEYKSKEIIVVLGESNDGSEEIIRKFDDKIKIIHEPSLPDGWIGKNWACYIGYQNSNGDLLLFTDGDTIHDKHLLSKAVSIIVNENVDMITFFPKFIFRSFWEKLITPLIAVFIGISNSVWNLNNDRSKSFLGNGQYILIRRNVYESIGGHQIIKNIIIEDYALAGLVKHHGYKLRGYNAPQLLKVKMYNNFSELWEGWTKNIYSGIGSLKRTIIFIFMLIGLIIPYISSIISLMQLTNNHFSLLLLNLLPTFLMLTAGFVIYKSYGTTPILTLLLPVTIFLIITLIINSTIKSLLSNISWKGKKYQKVGNVKEFLEKSTRNHV